MTGPGTPTMRGEYCEFTFPDGSQCVFGARHTVRYHHSETGLDAPGLPVEGTHVGRSWTGHHLEDSCPCPQEPCGLVNTSKADPSCPEHPGIRAKTIRRSHPASECPAREGGRAMAGREHMDLAEILSRWRPGSGDWDWPGEWADIAEYHGKALAGLLPHARENGIATPVLLGDDGRVWDGHKRLMVARLLGMVSVPVEHGHGGDPEFLTAEEAVTQAVASAASEGTG